MTEVYQSMYSQSTTFTLNNFVSFRTLPISILTSIRFEVIYLENRIKNEVDNSATHIKSVHFGHVHSQLFAPVNTDVHGKVLSLSYHAIVIFEQFILFFKGSFSCQCISRNHGDH